jgi:hypothetical protein
MMYALASNMSQYGQKTDLAQKGAFARHAARFSLARMMVENKDLLWALNQLERRSRRVYVTGFLSISLVDALTYHLECTL